MNNGEVNTLVFIDLEGTGLIETNSQKPHIIELFMLAVSRAQFLTPEKPRVLNKLRLTFSTNKPIQLHTSHLNGLYNDALEDQEAFNAETIELMNRFFSRLKKPVCLLAHNGLKYDFILLQSELLQNGIQFLPDLLCADTLLAFESIDKSKFLQNQFPESSFTKCALFQLHTPSKSTNKPISTASSPPKVSKLNSTNRDQDKRTDCKPVKRRLWNDQPILEKPTTPGQVDANTSLMVQPNCSVEENKDNKRNHQNKSPINTSKATINSMRKSHKSHKLVNIYKREFIETEFDAHCAEDDVMMMFSIAFKWNTDFLSWIDKYAVKFSDVSLL